MDAGIQVLWNHAPALTAHLGRVLWVHFDQFRPGRDSLVAEHPDEGSPGSVSDMFCETMILYHSIYVEVFNTDEGILVNDSGACLVEEVPSPVRDTGMEPPKSLDSLPPVHGALLFPGGPALEMFQPLLASHQCAGIVDYGSVREGCEALNPHVDADLLIAVAALVDGASGYAHTTRSASVCAKRFRSDAAGD